MHFNLKWDLVVSELFLFACLFVYVCVYLYMLKWDIVVPEQFYDYFFLESQ